MSLLKLKNYLEQGKYKKQAKNNKNIKNAKSCNSSSYKTLQNSWQFFKSTPLILAFQPEGKGISG